MRAPRPGSLRMLLGSVVLGGTALGFSSAAWAYGPTPSTPVQNSGGGPAVSPSSQSAPSNVTSGNGVLAFTGADIALMTAAGAAAIGAGGGVVLLSRRRKDGRDLSGPLPS